MKKIKLPASAIDTIISEEQARALIADLQAQLDTPEPVEFWEGQLCESEKGGVFRIANMRSDRPETFLCTGGMYWLKGVCRPLQDPLVLQFKPHVWQTDVRPCSDNTRVHLKFDNGGYLMDQLSGDMDWVDVIGWMPADGWGRSE